MARILLSLLSILTTIAIGFVNRTLETLEDLKAKTAATSHALEHAKERHADHELRLQRLEHRSRRQ
jgi:hypothetical protein